MRCQIIALIFACAVCHHFVFSQSSSNSNKKDDGTKTVFTKLISKFNDFIKKVDILEAESSTWNDAIEQLVQQNQQFEDRFEKIENGLLQFQKCLNVCDPNPCNGGRCEVTGSGYSCSHCPLYTSGKNCENVKCNPSNKCFKRNNSRYFVFENRGTWEEANLQCESKGMTLAEPKDEASTKFLIDQLRPNYGKDVVKRDVYFWIGLKYNKNEAQWQWNDGSALGDYTGGMATFKGYTREQCGVLYLGGGSEFWSSDNCLRVSKSYTVYALCEKRISVA